MVSTILNHLQVSLPVGGLFFPIILFIFVVMSMVRFIADLHFGHEAIALKRGFSSVEEHDEYIIKQWNTVTHKKDLTYILGDVTCETPKHYHLLDRLNGRKVVIMGNHDMRKHVRKLLEHVDNVAGLIKYKGIFLSHCPVHPREMEYRVSHNIHGHIHAKKVKKKILGFKVVDKRYICVSCEQVGYTPKTLAQLGINR
jgi:calcineurin-like phosphoesterase family protein